MTLVLSLLTPSWVLQVGDRLVTLKGEPSKDAKEWDALANKQLVVRTTDGLLALGYSGPAYLAGKPTDHAIAEILSDAQFDWVDGRLGMRVGAGTDVSTKALLERLTTQLQARLVQQSDVFWLDAAGGWSGKRGTRPVLTSLKYDPGSRNLKREDNWELLDQVAGAAVPPDALGLNEATKQMNESMHHAARSGGLIADDAEKAVVAAIRTCAGQSGRRIGPHCMSILIRADWSVRLRYLPEGDAPRVSLVSGRSTQSLPGTFTPWILTPQVVVPPRVMVGAGREQIGGVIVDIDGPPLPPGSGVHYAWSSQTRRDRPR